MWTRKAKDATRRRPEPGWGDGRVRWRTQQLVQAGLEAELAASLAANRQIDLHELINLVERGCPPRLAARILAPLNEV